jgi:alcohol oxidase
MSPTPPVPDTQHEYIPEQIDIIIAGGGTTGCIVAGRLAAADPTLTILVLEAGPPTLNNELHVQPAMYSHHLKPDSTTIKYVVAEKNENLNGRQTVGAHGQCLGGGSSVNCKYLGASVLMSER